MTESFLHYVWHKCLFRTKNLRTACGKIVSIIFPGIPNNNAGPDFLQARLRIDGLHWSGSVEIHINASDYLRHNHSSNPAYNNVILHVVWNNDKVIHRDDGSLLPVVSFQGRLDPGILSQYQLLYYSEKQLACQSGLSNINPSAIAETLKHSAITRLSLKTTAFMDRLNKVGWEAACWFWLCRSFGLKVNGDAFAELAAALSFRQVRRIISAYPNPNDAFNHLSAVMFGVAGFPGSYDDSVYHFWQTRLNLRSLPGHLFRFHRMRPSVHPNLQIRRLAFLLINIEGNLHYLSLSGALFTPLKHEPTFKSVSAAEQYFTPELISLIEINYYPPIWIAWSRYNGEVDGLTKAIDFIKSHRPESNKTTRVWNSVGVTASNAFESQAMIHQYHENCQKNNCMNCGIGLELMGRRAPSTPR